MDIDRNRKGKGKGKSKNSSNRNAFGKKQNDQKKSNSIVKVTGLVESDQKEAIALLKLKLPKNIQFEKSFWRSGALLISVPHNQVHHFRSQSGKINLAGRRLVFEVMESQKVPIPVMIEQLKSLVNSRFNSQTLFLNLENILEDPLFIKTGLDGFAKTGPEAKFGEVLCKIISDSCPNLKTLSLASNKINSLDFFGTLSRKVPGLENLSLKDNLLRSYTDLEPLKGEEFTNLRELILIGNPVVDMEVKKGTSGEINFKSRVKALFPSLKLLDGVELIEEIEFGIKQVEKLPVPVNIGFFDSQATKGTAQAFLKLFFESFDNNRPSLSLLYHEGSIFSYSINSQTPGTLFKQWNHNQRNLETVKAPTQRYKTLYTGVQSILDIMGKLPSTKHPIDASPSEKKFLFESFMHGVGADNAMYIFVHGEFSETIQSKGKDRYEKRSFDRTFILGPSAPGSAAANANIPVQIHNDCLILHAFQGNVAWRLAKDPSVKDTSDYPQLPPGPVLGELKRQNDLNQEQHGLVIEFAKHTGLNYIYSLQCLKETAWVPERALEAFNSVKDNIPPEAFKL